MQSIPLAIMWELLWRGRWGLIAAALGANLMQVLIFTALRMHGALDPTDPSQVTMHAALMPISALIFAVAAHAAQGPVARLFAFPVTTQTLVLWHFIPMMALVVIQSVASTVCLNAVYGTEWPLWGPALFVAVAIVSLQSAFWLMEKSGWAMLVLAGVTMALGIWFSSRYGGWFSQPTRFWREVTLSEALTMLGMTVTAYAVAVAGVARNRRGEAPFSLGILARLERVFGSPSDVSRPFRTAKQAQLWYEWRMKGWAFPAIVLLGLVAGLGIWSWTNRSPQDLIDGFVFGGSILAGVGLMCGFFVGASGREDFELGQFLATRPMTNTVITNAILKMATRSVMVGWGIWAAAFALAWVILIPANPGVQWGLPATVRWWYFPATLCGTWAAMNLIASLVLTGRRHLFAILYGGLIIIWVGWAFFSNVFLSQPARELLAQAMMVLGGALCVIGSAWCFLIAGRRALIGWGTLAIAISLWALLSIVTLLEWGRHPTEPLSVYLLVVGLLALAVAPVATAPLAYSWNRTR